MLEVRTAKTRSNATTLDESKVKIIFCQKSYGNSDPKDAMYCCLTTNSCYRTESACRAACLVCNPKCPTFGSRNGTDRNHTILHSDLKGLFLADGTNLSVMRQHAPLVKGPFGLVGETNLSVTRQHAPPVLVPPENFGWRNSSDEAMPDVLMPYGIAP